MSRLTIQDILLKKPCYNPQFKGMQIPESATLGEVLDIDSVPMRDRIWVVSEFLDPKFQRLFMIRCARLAISKVTEETIDPEINTLLTTCENFANGLATDRDLMNAKNIAWEHVRKSVSHEAQLATIMVARACGTKEKQLIPRELENEQLLILKTILSECGFN